MYPTNILIGLQNVPHASKLLSVSLQKSAMFAALRCPNRQCSVTLAAIALPVHQRKQLYKISRYAINTGSILWGHSQTIQYPANLLIYTGIAAASCHDHYDNGIAIGVPVGAGLGLLTGLTTKGRTYKADENDYLWLELTQDLSIPN